MSDQTLSDLIGKMEVACERLESAQRQVRQAECERMNAQSAMDAAVKAVSEYLVKNQPTVAQEIARAVRR